MGSGTDHPHRIALEPSIDVLDHVGAVALIVLERRVAQMRRRHDTGQRPVGVVVGQRLDIKDIQARTGDETSALADGVAARRLDLHHVGAEVAEHLGGVWPEKGGGQVEDPDPLERKHPRASGLAHRRWSKRRPTRAEAMLIFWMSMAPPAIPQPQPSRIFCSMG